MESRAKQQRDVDNAFAVLDDDHDDDRDTENLVLGAGVPTVRAESSIVLESERIAEDRRHRGPMQQEEMFKMTPQQSLSLMPTPAHKWDAVWGPPVEYDPRFPEGKPAKSDEEWDPFFGPPVRKGQGGRKWTHGEDPRVVRPPPVPHFGGRQTSTSTPKPVSQEPLPSKKSLKDPENRALLSEL
jgi:hypothetical protein